MLPSFLFEAQEVLNFGLRGQSGTTPITRSDDEDDMTYFQFRGGRIWVDLRRYAPIFYALDIIRPSDDLKHLVLCQAIEWVIAILIRLLP